MFVCNNATTKMQILHDKLFAHPTHRLILTRVKNQSAPTYLLRFNFESTYSLTKKIFAGRNVPGKNENILSHSFKKMSLIWCIWFSRRLYQVFVMQTIVHTTSDRCLPAQIQHKIQMNGKQLNACVKHLPHLHEPVIPTMIQLPNHNGNQSHSKLVIKMYLNTNA